MRTSSRSVMQHSLFEIMSPAELNTKITVFVDEVAELLGLPGEVVEHLLRAYRWQADELSQDWFSEPHSVLSSANIGWPPMGSNESEDEHKPHCATRQAMSQEFLCPILAETVPLSETEALACGHTFSKKCWERYLEYALDEGTEVILNKRCPNHGCEVLVSGRLWRLLKPSLYKRYESSRIEAFVQRDSAYRQCSGVGCTYIAHQSTGKQDNNMLTVLKANAVSVGAQGGVSCICGARFCMGCGTEPHWPVLCETVRRWHDKNQREAANMNWILKNTKTCPSCKQCIEKSHGCMHMICRCRYEFCWLCLGDWRSHDTNSFFRCNVYEKFAGGPKTISQKSRERYLHFFERFRAHNQGQQVAAETQLPLITRYIDEVHKWGYNELDFLKKAVEQIIDCRRMLKWSYVFGYSAKWRDHSAKKSLFDGYQSQLERTLDILHEKVEQFDPDRHLTQAESLRNFRTDLMDLTRVVGGFFQRISEAYEREQEIESEVVLLKDLRTL